MEYPMYSSGSWLSMWDGNSYDYVITTNMNDYSKGKITWAHIICLVMTVLDLGQAHTPPLSTVRILVEDARVNLGLWIKNPPPVLLHRTLPDPPRLKHLWLLWSGHAPLYIPVLFWGTNLKGVFLQSQDKCPTSLHLKQAPFLISLVPLSTVIALTSIVFGSGIGLKLNFRDPFLSFWAGDFPADQVIIWFKLAIHDEFSWPICTNLPNLLAHWVTWLSSVVILEGWFLWSNQWQQWSLSFQFSSKVT